MEEPRCSNPIYGIDQRRLKAVHEQLEEMLDLEPDGFVLSAKLRRQIAERTAPDVPGGLTD